MEHSYKTSGTCSTRIDFDLEGNVVHNVRFTRGCNGNLKAIGILTEGMTVEEIEAKLAGNTCGPRSTSCADQLAKAVRQAYDQEHAGAAQ